MTDHERLAQEPDRVPTRRLAVTGFAGLLVFAAGALWAATVQRGETGSVRSDTAPPPALAGRREVGMVYQPPFGESIAAAKNEKARRRLSSAGWVDRDGGVAHIPIEQAMEIVVRRGKL
jgi:hypothetical protein